MSRMSKTNKPLTGIRYPARVKVNTTGLELAIREGCNPMQKMVDPAHGNLPYFSNIMSGSDPGNGHHPSVSMGHMPGRWLNALLNAEDAVGVRLNEQIIRDLTRWTYISLDHPMGIAMDLDIKTFKPIPGSDLHNLRETMHALYALVKYRRDKTALNIARKQIQTVDTFYNFDTGVWDEKAFNRRFAAKTNAGDPFPRHFGRYIGPLVKLYKACGMKNALIQAIKLKNFAFKNIIGEEGKFDVKLFGPHIHSTTSMLSSLAQLGEVLNDNDIFERVMVFMENGGRDVALDFGWSIEDYYRTDHYGEINNTTDIMETCLIFGKAGYTRYFQQAERILRAHLLPSQLLDTCFIPDWDVPEEDYHHKLATRSKGAFGFPCPYGHEYNEGGWISFNWDIVGGAVSGLCEAFRDKVTREGSIISVNLLFDHKDKDVEVKSPYTNNDVMEIKARCPSLIRVRLSDWVERDKLCVTNYGKRTKMIFSGDWLYLPELGAKSLVRIKIPMKVVTTDYRFRGDTFTFRWRGDAVDAVRNLASRLCFLKSI